MLLKRLQEMESDFDDLQSKYDAIGDLFLFFLLSYFLLLVYITGFLGVETTTAEYKSNQLEGVQGSLQIKLKKLQSKVEQLTSDNTKLAEEASQV